MIPALRRQQQRATPQRTHAGACNGGCSCNACPKGNGPYTVNDIANLLGRTVAGMSGRCKYNFVHLANSNKAVGIAAGASETITENVQFGLCINQIVATPRQLVLPGVTGTFLLSNLMLGNKPQWLMNRSYHSALFQFDAECSCCLPGDCTTVGTLASITVTNSGALASNIDVYLIGPSTG